MDEFLIRHTLQHLQQQINAHQDTTNTYFSTNDSNLATIDGRLDSLDETTGDMNSVISSLQTLISELQSSLDETNKELVKTKLVNLKQEIVIRTLHNLNSFDAYDMFTDTFSNAEGIDWDRSIRAEHLTEWGAVGRTNQAIKEIAQESAPTRLLISKNGSSDEAIAQTFSINKQKEVEKVSVLIEAFSENTWQPLVVRIREGLNGTVVSETSITPNDFSDGWVDIDIPNYLLSANTEYVLELSTDDIYGYKVGVDTIDQYLPGTSYSAFEGTWTDNNYDIGFIIWCYAAADENNATIYTITKNLSSVPESIVFEKEDTIINGTILYHVSRDGGVNWKLLQSGVVTDLNDLPEGNDLVIKAYIEGDSRVEAWGYVVTRSDT